MTAVPEPFAPGKVPVRSLDVRARNFRGKLLVARADAAIELDEVGTCIFKNIDGAATMNEIAAKIAAEYGIPHELALADSSEFVAELLSLGIVSTKEEPGVSS